MQKGPQMNNGRGAAEATNKECGEDPGVLSAVCLGEEEEWASEQAPKRRVSALVLVLPPSHVPQAWQVAAPPKW
jgi:hypothetical protein